MAQTLDPSPGSKRGPGRPAKALQPALKKAKTSTPQTPLSSTLHSPAGGESPTPGQPNKKLPSRTYDNRPLPTLPSPQPPSLPKEEYQSLSTSAVLHASLDRSRAKWTHHGILERYWRKPEAGKSAKPPPPGNPEVKWQKHKGPCRIRIEPHIFEAEVYVEEREREKEKVVAKPGKQYAPPQNAQVQGYGGRPGFGNGAAGGGAYGASGQYQGRRLPPLQQPATPGPIHPSTLPPIQNLSQQQPPPPTPQQGAGVRAQQPEKKASPDPVISMLANRASSDPELKALMKEVATGNATQDQLKVFQGHIDDLTKIITEKKRKKEDDEAEEEVSTPQAAKTDTQTTEVIQYDGSADGNAPATPFQQQQQQRPPYAQTQQQPLYHQQQPWAPPPPQPPPAPTSQPVILQFTTPGSTDDRFLFPRHSILESLSPQHLLASFLVTRPSGTSTSDTESSYYQPITLMVEVAYNREHILECVRRWVKPAEEVREFMREVMGRCGRAEERFLALRLPVRGSGDVEDGDDGVGVGVVEEKRPRVKYVKKTFSKGEEKGKKEKEKGVEESGKDLKETAVVPSTQGHNALPAEKDDDANAAVGIATAEVIASKDPTHTDAEADETARPRRTTRKSVRIM